MSFIVHPLIAGEKTGTPEWFIAQREMIRSKPAVRRCYNLWYAKLISDIQSVAQDGLVVELGSGSSYIKELMPDVITSDVVPGPVDLVVDGRHLPFANNSVKALLLTHVFHHIPDVRRFLREAERVLVPGGVISMIDCAHTPLSRFFFGKIHPEPYNHMDSNWDFQEGAHMMDSNQALTWIVFHRDLETFRREFPGLVYEGFEYLPWFGYLLSGGVNLRSLVPPFAARAVEALDRMLKPLDFIGAIHWRLTIRRGGEKQEEVRRRELHREAQYLYSSFFCDSADVVLRDRYARAHERYGIRENQVERRMMYKLQSLHLDAEAVEYFLRLKDRGNILTRKVEILHFLAECEPPRSGDFFNSRNVGPRAWLYLFGALGRTVRCFVKGRILVRRYGLA
jgi:SAM-dependent methyltransferase